MLKRYLITVMIFILLLSCGCDTGTPDASVEVRPTASSTVGTGTPLEPAPSGKEFLFDASGNVIQRSEVRDYSLAWWRDGFNKGGKWQMNIQTGHYGLAFNTVSGKLMKLGVIKEEISQAQAAIADNDLIESLDGITTSYFAINQNGEECAYTGTAAIGTGSYSSRILETGRFISRIDVMKIRFQGLDPVVGRVEISAMPRYLALEIGLFSPDDRRNDLGVGMEFKLTEDYGVVYRAERAVTVAKKDGSGFSVVVPKDATVEAEGNVIRIKRSLKIKKNDLDGLSVIVIPSANARGQDAVNYLAGSELEAQAVQISPKEGKEQKTVLDMTKGYLTVDMSAMSTYRHSDFQQEERLDELDRLTITLTNPTNADITMLVQLLKEGSFAVEGMSVMLRDVQSGEPTGHYVQMCRNWHNYSTDKNGNYAARNDPRRIWSGTWFHGYTLIDVPAGKTVTYEVTVAYPKWGGVFACSHSQLCLAGWGGNYQQWETSTVGSFSDSFCYDIEKAHGTGAAINDVLPLLCYGSWVEGQKYNWPSGVSGSDFFAMYDKNGKEVPLKQLTTRLIKQGPCINEVVYSGITKDDAVRIRVQVNMSRTNDAAKATYNIKYDFLKDVEFSRLYFFAFGADDYNTSFSKITLGNMDGDADFTLGGKSYNGTMDIDYSTVGEGYIDADKQQRIEIGGEGLFVLERCSTLYEQQYGEPGARMMHLISWSSLINGKQYDKPSVSIKVNKAAYGANNIPCAVVELGAPAEAGSIIKKGSTVEGTVQFVPLPTHIGEGLNGYYGPDEGIRGVPGEGDEFIKNLAMYFLRGERLEVIAQKGTVTSLYPVAVELEQDEAEITLRGGTGHVALTFMGAEGYSGYVLERLVEGTWVKVDQSVYGNDFWQCFYDAVTQSYQHTYNVPSSDGLQSFRFKKA